jgi:hypothetical protein
VIKLVKWHFIKYQSNLQNNPLNTNSPSFTLGTIRTQYETICENLSTLSGPINGANNTETWAILCHMVDHITTKRTIDFGWIFLRSEAVQHIFSSLQYNSNEYLKFKGQMLNAVTTSCSISNYWRNIRYCVG